MPTLWESLKGLFSGRAAAGQREHEHPDPLPTAGIEPYYAPWLRVEAARERRTADVAADLHEWEAGLNAWEAIDAMVATDRAAIIRQTFDAHVDILFVKSKEEFAGDLSLTGEMLDHVRRAFREHMEQHWPEWQAELADYSDDRLYFMREDYYDQLNGLGLKERQHQQAAREAVEYD